MIPKKLDYSLTKKYESKFSKYRNQTWTYAFIFKELTEMYYKIMDEEQDTSISNAEKTVFFEDLLHSRGYTKQDFYNGLKRLKLKDPNEDLADKGRAIFNLINEIKQILKFRLIKRLQSKEFSTVGVIFMLKNYYGWTDNYKVKEVEDEKEFKIENRFIFKDDEIDNIEDENDNEFSEFEEDF